MSDAAPSNRGRNGLIGVVGVAVAAALTVFVSHQEGTVPRTYLDPIGIKTACVGHTGPELKLGQTFSPEECSEMLAGDLIAAAHGVQDCITVELSDGELTAWTSFTFNVGVRQFCESTAARLLNSGKRVEACEQLSRWTRAGGRVLPGLVKRRAAELALCERDITP